MNSMKKSALAAALSAGLIGGGAAGVILGGTGVSGAQETTTTVAAGAGERDGGEQGRPDRGERLAEVLAPLVEDGTIDQTQADAVIAALEEAGPPMGGHGGRGHGGFGIGSGAVAEALGMEEEDLREALRDGQTLSQIAEAQGVDVQVVIDAMVAELRTHLDERVADGDLTQEEADERLAEATERITERIDEAMPRGPRGERPDDAPAEEDGASED
jgi:hypothetical protein